MRCEHLRKKIPVVKCTVCRHVGKAKRWTNFSVPVYILLLFVGLIPGIIYSRITLSNMKFICANCDSENVIPCRNKGVK